MARTRGIVVGLLFAAAALAGCGGGSSGSDGSLNDPSSSVSGAGSEVFGEGVETDLAVYLKAGLADQEITDTVSSMLFTTTPGRQGEAMIEGVHGVQTDYGAPAVFVDFDKDASEDRIIEIISQLESSPVVVDTQRNVTVSLAR